MLSAMIRSRPSASAETQRSLCGGVPPARHQLRESGGGPRGHRCSAVPTVVEALVQPSGHLTSAAAVGFGAGPAGAAGAAVLQTPAARGVSVVGVGPAVVNRLLDGGPSAHAADPEGQHLAGGHLERAGDLRSAGFVGAHHAAAATDADHLEVELMHAGGHGVGLRPTR